MRRDRHVVLGAARGDAAWFHDVSRWAMSGTLGIEYVKALDAAEVRARLTSGRRFSAVLLDGHLDRVDRDLVQLAHDAGAVVVVLGGPRRDWAAIGIDATLPGTVTADELQRCLDQTARPVNLVPDVLDAVDPQGVHGQPGEHTERAEIVEHDHRSTLGRFVVVTGAGGAGVSTVAMALAQHFGASGAGAAATLLADLTLHADHALLHHVGDVVPGVVELVDAFRLGRATPESVLAHTFPIEDRGYHLLAGLRRPREWSVLRRAALGAALDATRATFDTIVAEVTPDFDGELATGSADIEHRNELARAALRRADVVVVVSRAGVHGVHRLVRTVHEVVSADLTDAPIVPVVTRVPRRPGRRAPVARAVLDLISAADLGDIPSPVFVPECRSLDTRIHDAAPLPDAILEPLAATIGARVAAIDPHPTSQGVAADPGPVPVAIGSLGPLDDGESDRDSDWNSDRHRDDA